MRKRKSTRETKNMIQTALWLPRDMHEKLKKKVANGDLVMKSAVVFKLLLTMRAHLLIQLRASYLRKSNGSP